MTTLGKFITTLAMAISISILAVAAFTGNTSAYEGECSPSPGESSIERNSYFAGRYLDAVDLETVQECEDKGTEDSSKSCNDTTLRNSYFEGKLLTAKDFHDERIYTSSLAPKCYSVAAIP